MSDDRRNRPPRKPIDPRVKALLAIVLAIALAVSFALIMTSLQNADDCLAMAGRHCS